jgi:NitT/TauT family transport system ATP-binding protein
MKQRVGIARALARGPELLCMDEPFSALDVFTAEGLRSELYRLWVRDSATSEGPQGSGGEARLPEDLKAILMVTHLIEEAVFLADRIVVMSARPGRIRQILRNDLPHPRDYQDPAFLATVQRLHDLIVAEHLPEPAPPQAATAQLLPPAPEPLPPVHVGEIFGLLRILGNHGGKMGVFALDKLTRFDFGHTLSVIKAGEMLDFIDTPGNTVVLTPAGRLLLQQDARGRKTLLHEQMVKLEIFRLLVQMLRDAKGHRLPSVLVRQELAARLPTEDAERLLATAIGWGRAAALIQYDRKGDALTLGRPAGSGRSAA